MTSTPAPVVPFQGFLSALGVGVRPSGSLSFCGEPAPAARGIDGFRMTQPVSRLLYMNARPIRESFWLGIRCPLDASGLGEGWMENVEVPIVAGNVTNYETGGGGGYVTGQVTVGAFVIPSPDEKSPLAGVAAYVGSTYADSLNEYPVANVRSETWLGVLSGGTGAFFRTDAEGRRAWRGPDDADLQRFAGCLSVAEKNADSAVKGLLHTLAGEIDAKPMHEAELLWMFHSWSYLNRHENAPWR